MLHVHVHVHVHVYVCMVDFVRNKRWICLLACTCPLLCFFFSLLTVYRLYSTYMYMQNVHVYVYMYTFISSFLPPIPLGSGACGCGEGLSAVLK